MRQLNQAADWLGQETGQIREIPWPDVADQIQDTAQAVALELYEIRRERDLKASAWGEEHLPEQIEELLNQAQNQPGHFRLHGGTATRLATEPHFRRQVHRAAMVLGSWLYPLSRLLYLVDGLEEIHVYRWDKWLLTTNRGKFRLGQLGNPFSTNQEVQDFLRERVLAIPGVKGNKTLSDRSPAAEANLGRVLRLAVIQEPAVSGDTTFVATMRLQGVTNLHSLDEYVMQGAMPRGVAEFLTASLRGKANIIIAGGTATGKTTLLRVLCGMVPPEEQILVLEDSAELNLDTDRGDGQPWHPLVQHLCTVPPLYSQDAGLTMRDLAKLALRMRPSRIILGEARDAAMAEVCLVASTGHDGSMVTIHADDAFEGLRRSAEYVMKSPDYSHNSNSMELAELAVHRAFDLVVHLSQNNIDGQRRLSGVLALGGLKHQHTWLYQRVPEGHVERRTRYVADLPLGLKLKIGSRLGQEIPEP
ncbi:MAG: hypothetical protein DLM66_06250 [Candidatus Dormiibacter spiritus]|uniref:CpaF/VirB11 family protein n=1 Tax=Candidatus Dormibacter sp. TaxID=2973982 RepID=UPI000DB6E7F1|nr:MAG: hypothetical protein DLM66_06250 [Candidatus Dormibacteraeota bacterium]